jgi:hypothetical protein
MNQPGGVKAPPSDMDKTLLINIFRKQAMENNLSSHTVAELKNELPEGLKIFAETALGWSELKASAFVRQMEKHGFSEVSAFCEVRKNGAITLKVPR